MIQKKSVKFDGIDLDLFNSRNWYWRGGKGIKYLWGYPKGGPVKSGEYFARLIMMPRFGFVVDHINGDTSDNRRENLRVCTVQENRMNQRKTTGKTSRFKGVSKMVERKMFVAQIKHGRKVIYLGSFESEFDAAIAYDTMARKLFGDYAKLNFKEILCKE